MVTVIKSKIISFKKSQEGDMCVFDKSFKFENLLTWVYRNCPGYSQIKVNIKDIEVIYEDRVEIYFIKKIKATTRNANAKKYT